MNDYIKHYAFARGYLHGFVDGEERNPYDDEERGVLRNLYRDGYDAGVADYCLANHGEEVDERQ